MSKVKFVRRKLRGHYRQLQRRHRWESPVTITFHKPNWRPDLHCFKSDICDINSLSAVEALAPHHGPPDSKTDEVGGRWCQCLYDECIRFVRIRNHGDSGFSRLQRRTFSTNFRNGGTVTKPLRPLTKYLYDLYTNWESKNVVFIHQLTQARITRHVSSLVDLLNSIKLVAAEKARFLESRIEHIRGVICTVDEADGSAKAVINDGDSDFIEDLLVTGLLELCKIKLNGNEAIQWLGEWLLKNNPSKLDTDNRVAIVDSVEQTMKWAVKNSRHLCVIYTSRNSMESYTIVGLYWPRKISLYQQHGQLKCCWH